MPPIRDAPPAGGPRDGGSVGLGILLGLAWAAGSFVLTGAVSGIGYGAVAAGTAAALQAASLLLVLGSLVAIHWYAIAKGKARILIGFWGFVLVGALAFVVTCFALVFAAFG
jgi:hypothetical protein